MKVQSSNKLTNLAGIAIVVILLFVLVAGSLSIVRESFFESLENIYGSELASKIASFDYKLVRFLSLATSLMTLIWFLIGKDKQGFLILSSLTAVVYISLGLLAYFKTGIFFARVGNTLYLPGLMVILGGSILLIVVLERGVLGGGYNG